MVREVAAVRPHRRGQRAKTIEKTLSRTIWESCEFLKDIKDSEVLGFGNGRDVTPETWDGNWESLGVGAKHSLAQRR